MRSLSRWSGFSPGGLRSLWDKWRTELRIALMPREQRELVNRITRTAREINRGEDSHPLRSGRRPEHS